MNKAFNNIKRGLSIINCQLFIVLLLGLLACSDEMEVPDTLPEGETARVPIAFNLQNVGDGLTTRVPSNEGPSCGNAVRPVRVDKVDVYLYSRPADGEYNGDNALDFTRVGKYTFAVADKGDDAWPRYVAEGWVELSGSKEYRMTAIAYNSEEVEEENKPFTVTEGSFKDAAIQLTAITNPFDGTAGKEEYNAPELFFGTVLAFDRDTLFTYDDVKGEEAALSGWLYRGVAGIQLSLFNVPDNVEKIELLADTIYTEVGARYYDDFLYAYEPQKEMEYKRFALGGIDKDDAKEWAVFAAAEENEETVADIKSAIKRDDNTIITDDDINNKLADSKVFHIVGPNLLTDICTSLSVRITENNNGTAETKFARLRLKETGTVQPSAQGLSTKSAPMNGDEPAGPGTGIIDYEIPGNIENPDADDPNAPFRVCFQRNNYYQIVGDYEKLLTQKYTLRVLVNPNWDGNVELSLEKDLGGSSTNP